LKKTTKGLKFNLELMKTKTRLIDAILTRERLQQRTDKKQLSFRCGKQPPELAQLHEQEKRRRGIISSLMQGPWWFAMHNFLLLFSRN